jgi:mannose-6-phosphate isomerase-like protein (cupin superfamily)
MTQVLSHRRPGAALAEFIPAGEGDSLTVITPLTFKVRPGQTHSRMEIHEQTIPPGVLIPPHRHEHQAQWTYVVSGRLGCRVGDEEYTLNPGDSIWRPQRITHALWNTGPAPVVMLETSTPADDIMGFFAAVDELTRSGRLTQERVAQLAAPYGITYDEAMRRQLETRYAVSAAGGQWLTARQGVE